MAEKIGKYFRELTVTVPLKIDGEIVRTASGEAVTHEIYIDPPTVSGLSDYLHISRRTFSGWVKDEESRYHVPACEAKQRIEAYLESRLCVARNTDGVKFSLINNFRESWSDQKVLELGEETRKSEALTNISLADKLALIVSASEKAKATMGAAADSGTGDGEDAED